MGPADWGDVPTWIGGAGAFAAGWFAYQTIRSQRQQIGEQRAFIAEQTRFMNDQRQNLELERAELRAVAEDRRWTHAKHILVQAKNTYVTLNGEPARKWRVTVVNSSDAPVTEIEVRFGTTHTAVSAYEWHVKPEQVGARQIGERLTLPLPVLGPGTAMRAFSESWQDDTAILNRPTLFFTDSDSVRWSLDSYGKLTEASDGGA
ncbi:hypothetical protein [Streptomyces scabiei]|uniref:hypothetical protein n=1 Tax=Streptomyces scabiei TaxID=1930 RepID=UPI0029A8ADD6|nr:hypothetical protein [Streptomyces scabiei]MDX2807407.1 hypothetical protein [Streptomyces scabiei]